MQFIVYILYSRKLNRFYVGSTSDMTNRLVQHNAGQSSFTKSGIPWILLWTTTKPSRILAEKLEFKIKNLSHQRKFNFMQKYDEGVEDLLTLASLGQHGPTKG